MKEHPVKKRAYTVTLAVLVALMVASGASAKKADRYSAAKKAERHAVAKTAARHVLVRRAPEAKQHGKAAAAKTLRRAGRGSF
jgi:hypothetical protein